MSAVHRACSTPSRRGIGWLVVYLVMDNYGTDKTELVKNWLIRHSRFHVHFNPTSASWLNQVERWFATLTRRCIRRSTHRSTRQLEQAIRQHIDINNASPKPFIWSKTADDNGLVISMSADLEKIDNLHEID